MLIVKDPEELYIKQERIDKCSYGDGIFKGIIKKTQEPVIILLHQLPHICDCDPDEYEDPIEQSFLSRYESPFIVKYHDYYLKDITQWLILEFMEGGSVRDLMKPGLIDEMYIAIILRGLLKALEYIHSIGRVHLNVKASKIYLTSNGNVKLSCIDLETGIEGERLIKNNTWVNGPYWMAPELCKDRSYSSSSDIWSVGITAIEIATGEPPHIDLHPMRVLFLIPKNPAPRLEGNFSSDFKDFVAICLNKVANERPTAKELLEHRFIKAAKDPHCLTELIARKKHWRPICIVDPFDCPGDEIEGIAEENDEVGWDFPETIKIKSHPPA